MGSHWPLFTLAGRQQFYKYGENNVKYHLVPITHTQGFPKILVKTRGEHYSPRVVGSIPIRCNFFAEFNLLLYNSGRTPDVFDQSKNDL